MNRISHSNVAALGDHYLCQTRGVVQRAGSAWSASPRPAVWVAGAVSVLVSCANVLLCLGAALPATQVPGSDSQDRYLGGAPLKTDPDLMALLDKADKYRQDGNYRVAAKLWQSVLQSSSDTLFSDDGETYYALTDRVESILAGLPDEGLRAYRISADADAKELMAQARGPNDLDTLSQVVKSYFLSSLGDDAAFRLACIYLDRYDFVGAVRLLRKIADNYPDPSVPLDEVWLRIAVCYAYVGDHQSARQAWETGQKLSGPSSQVLASAVQQLITESPTVRQPSASAANWTTRLGDARRLRVMPALSDGYMTERLAPAWQYFFEPRENYSGDNYEGQVVSGPAAESQSVGRSETTVISSWRKGHWRPAGQLLFFDGRVVFKTGADLTVWDANGAAIAEKPLWRPLWLNQFAIDQATATWKQVYEAYARFDRSRGGKEPTIPTRDLDIQLFGDRIAQSMSIYRDVLYNVEGEPFDSYGSTIRHSRRPTRFSYGAVPRRVRTNYLTAYDLETGMLKWRVPALDPGDKTDSQTDEPDDFRDIGFMAAPVGFGDFVIVPVNLGGSIWLYALDTQAEGRLVWKSYLCDEPTGGSQAWAPIDIAIEGSSAYVSCGTGVVFAVDPMTGGIRFARRHERTGQANDLLRRFGGQSEYLELDGWQEDFAIPYGNWLVVLASDYNAVWAIDRETAQFAWKTENRPFGEKFDYLIGIYDDYVYLGGSKAVAAISLSAQGRWEWVQSFDDEVSYGQAMLTDGGLYVPVGNSIIKYAHKSEDGYGRELARSHVTLPGDAPVGNLFSDGHRIWVVEGNRLCALEPAPKDESLQPGEPANGAGASRATPATRGAGSEDK